MENKYMSVVMILVLVVMAAIGGEAVPVDPLCEQKCRSACRSGHGFSTLPECYTDCVRRQCFPPTYVYNTCVCVFL
ncbi:hypothetical protein ARALYDRAFT_332533 [Arabidopsis lyrata subsp. lyrata]|uniref:Uncharacterized protein n=1 Tax=Arabidopsis lyrata subsp. lyrata TaxID=81972 RepID=D7MNE8_ARALL|nr:hypothetical protein ARALYDRAFT_332533 [Arabidopsis lyrata subsp. lyrata]